MTSFDWYDLVKFVKIETNLNHVLDKFGRVKTSLDQSIISRRSLGQLGTLFNLSNFFLSYFQVQFTSI